MLERFRLADCFIEHDGDGCSQVEASDFRIDHWDGEASIPVRAQQVFRQAARLTTEDEAIVHLELPVRVISLSLCRKKYESGVGQCLVESFHVAVTMKLNFRPVIQSGAAHGAIIKAKTRHAYDVQRHTGRRAQTRDIARIWRDFRLNKRNVHKTVNSEK